MPVRSSACEHRDRTMKDVKASSRGSSPDDLIDRMLRRESSAYREAVALCGPAMMRVATAILKDRASAEEVVQDAWLAMFQSLASFERRSSLRTWAVSIVANRARTRLSRAARELVTDFTENDSLYGADAFDARGSWSGPQAWSGSPLLRLEQHEMLQCVQDALATMPAMQAAVMSLQDLEQLDPIEVCNSLSISESNRRVLLHRARARVRAAWLALVMPEEKAP